VLCGGRQDHQGLLPLFLADDRLPLPRGCYSTDLPGSSLYQFPLIVVSPQTRSRMKAAAINGARFTPIFQRSDYPDWRDAPILSLR
jgi:hypothetical protein